MRPFSFAALTAIALSLTTPVMAQEMPTDLPEINAEDVSVGQIVSFVNAMIAAERVRKEYLAKIDLAETEEEIDALLAEADQKGIAEVERVPGISPAEYMAIAIAAKDNEDLSSRIERRFNQLAQSQALTVTPGRAKRPDGQNVVVTQPSGDAAE